MLGATHKQDRNVEFEAAGSRQRDHTTTTYVFRTTAPADVRACV